MMVKRGIVFITLLTLLGAIPAYAQWEGSLKADGAWNFKQSNSENLDFRIGYGSDKLHIGTRIYFGHSFMPSEKTTSILDAKKEKGEFYKGELKNINPCANKTGAEIDFGYLFNPANSLNVALGYGWNATDENSDMLSDRYNNGDKDVLNGRQLDTSLIRRHRINSRIAYNHKFRGRPQASLDVVLTGLVRMDGEVNRRITSGTFYSRPKNYATYSSLNDFNSALAASYSDIFEFSHSKLKMKAGIDFASNRDLDAYSAETLENGQWRDSTRYRQSYFYNSNALEPYVNLTFSWRNFDFVVRERVQLYRHALIDKLDEKKTPEELVGLFDKFDAENLLGAGISYRFNDRHRLALDYNKSIARPDYKKLCPTMTIGKSEGEYFIGNPNLLPETTGRVNVNYTYSRELLQLIVGLNYRDKRNTAEKVIDLEKSKDIADPMVKTIYTWINNKRQSTLGTRLDLKVDGKSVKTGIWAEFNYDKFWKDGNVNKEEISFGIGTTVDVMLNPTTKLSSDITYLSARHSAYSFKGEDLFINLGFVKTLTEGLDLCIELRDIADTDSYEETWNAQMNYFKAVTTRPMTFAALLGLKYSF